MKPSRSKGDFRNLIAAAMLCALSLTGCSDGSAPTDPEEDPPVVTKAAIGPGGGTMTGPSGAFTMVFPPLTFPGTTDVTITQLTDGPADARVVPNTLIEFKFESLRLNRATVLSIAYDPGKVPVSMGENSLRLARLTPGGWQLAGNIQFNGGVDTVANTIIGAVYDPGVYAVRSLPIDFIRLYGAHVDGALYVGQTASIGVNMYRGFIGGFVEETPSRPIAWKSSSPSMISVDPAGKLTGLALGSATITATVEGVSATTALTVLTRPTANWTGATDWTTYQGNARRNGYINVSADPVVFRERWVKTPDAAVQSFHQATASGDRVFLATRDGKRQILALDAADGAIHWQKDFGPVSHSNQPTYDNGSLYMSAGGPDSYMYALNATNGSERFRVRLPVQRTAMQAPVIAGSAVVTAAISGDGNLYGFDRTTGSLLFDKSGTGDATAGVWTPAAGSGLIYTTTGGVNVIDADNGNTVRRLTDLRVQHTSTPVLGSVNNLLTQSPFRLVSVDLAAQRVAWDHRADSDLRPVAGNGVVYSSNNGMVVARNESDGTLKWSWKPAAPFTTLRAAVLTNNLLLVSISTLSPAEGHTVAIDLASHLAVWSYPVTGLLSINGDGTLYIVQFSKVAAVGLR